MNEWSLLNNQNSEDKQEPRYRKYYKNSGSMTEWWHTWLSTLITTFKNLGLSPSHSPLQRACFTTGEASLQVSLSCPPISVSLCLIWKGGKRKEKNTFASHEFIVLTPSPSDNPETITKKKERKKKRREGQREKEKKKGREGERRVRLSSTVVVPFCISC